MPAAHYFMGGILTDADGRTSINGLWACGECTSTGAHGANRLASNSLLEAVVFSARIAAKIGKGEAKHAEDWSKGSVDRDDLVAEADTAAMSRLRKTMSASFGVIRDREGMMQGLKTIVELRRANRDAAFPECSGDGKAGCRQCFAPSRKAEAAISALTFPRNGPNGSTGHF